MREDFDAVLHDLTLTRLALAIAVGWSLYQLAHGVGTFIDGLFTNLPAGVANAISAPITGGALTWVVGHRLVTLDAAFVGAVELVLSLGAALYVGRRRSRS